MSVINFTVEYDLLASLTDSADMGADADVVPLTGTITFTPLFSDTKAVLAPGYTPRPAGFKIRPFVGVVDTDGQLKAAKGGAVGVRLWANDPVFDLDQLTYKVSFDVSTTLGQKVPIEDGYFEALDTDGTLNLADVLVPTGSPSIGNSTQLEVYAHEIVDSTDVGVDLMTAADAAAARDAIDAEYIGAVTPIKTSGYQAQVGEIIPCDASAAGFTVSLPATPVDGSRVIVKKIDASSNAVLVQRTGSDVINEASSTVQLLAPSQCVTLRYADGSWLVVGNSVGPTYFDTQYTPLNAGEILDRRGKRILGLDASSVATPDCYLQIGNTDASDAYVPLTAVNSLGGTANLRFVTSGTGVIEFYEQATLDYQILRLTGESTNVYLLVQPKGNEGTYFRSNTQQNGVGVFGAVNGSAPSVKAFGQSDSNVNLELTPKGTGKVKVNGVDVLLNGGALGTPSSATLTNATGLPVSGITASTSTALGVGSVELGHASDTTLTRVSAGIVAVEGVNVALSTDTERANELTSGESTMPRRFVSQTAVASGSQSLRLTYFTARKTETISQVRIPTGGTAASGATLCRIGIYEEASNGDLTLVASTANDTNLWIATSTVYTKSLSASFTKTRGTRYAVGLLFVGTTGPNFTGQTALNLSEANESPRLNGLVGSQLDLPASISNSSITGQSHASYVVLLP